MADKDKARVTFCAAATTPTPQCPVNLNSKENLKTMGVATKDQLQRDAIALDKLTTSVYNSLSLGNDNDSTLQSGPTIKGPGKSG